MHIASAIDNLNPTWKKLLCAALSSKTFHKLQTFLNNVSGEVFPPISDIFNAYNFTTPKNVKVVILGQDPYHDVNQAHGLAFSVQNNDKLPPSLKNIFKELADDYNLPIRSNGNLISWAKQGVFLLNSVLTVNAHEANSHQGEGWEEFTDATIEAISREHHNVVFILWGKSAASKVKLIDESKHKVLKASHPSPLSVYRTFWKSKPFSQTNDYLVKHNKIAIDWYK